MSEDCGHLSKGQKPTPTRSEWLGVEGAGIEIAVFPRDRHLLRRKVVVARGDAFSVDYGEGDEFPLFNNAHSQD